MTVAVHTDTQLGTFLDLVQQKIINSLNLFFATYPQEDEHMLEALRYVMGGKHIRAAFFYAVVENLLGHYSCDMPALALELVHSYSLVHDDLPAMDNADLRRNKPACHIQYGEANAILIGDALQALAFTVLTKADIPAARKIKMIDILSTSIGPQGMVLGQMLDIQEHNANLATLQRINRYKTGALFSATLHLGYLTCREIEPTIATKLTELGFLLGEIFQIKDDLLDTSPASGKTSNLDMRNQKPTIKSLLGIQQTKKMLLEKITIALSLCTELFPQPSILRNLIHFLGTRDK